MEFPWSIVGVVFGAYFTLLKQLTPIYLHDVLAGEVKQVQKDLDVQKKELDIHRKENYLKDMKQRIWTIKERHGEKPVNKTTREELISLEDEKKELEEYLKRKKSE